MSYIQAYRIWIKWDAIYKDYQWSKMAVVIHGLMVDDAIFKFAEIVPVVGGLEWCEKYFLIRWFLERPHCKRARQFV